MSDRTLIVDGTGVARRWSGGSEAVRWDALARVEVVTTDDGPFAEDFFWLLGSKDGVTGVCIGGAEADAVQLLRVLGERLPGLDHEAVIVACGSCAPARFLVWQDSGFVAQSNLHFQETPHAGAGVGADGGASGWWTRLLAWWT